MYCYNCKKDIDVPIEKENEDKLLTFINNKEIDQNVFNLIKSEDQQSINLVSDYIFNEVLRNEKFIDDFTVFVKSINSSEVQCPICGNKQNYYSLNWFHSELSEKIQQLQFEYLEKIYTERCGVNPTRLISILNNIRGVRGFYLDEIPNVFPEKKRT